MNYSKPYQALASYYRKVMEHVDYAHWASYLKKLLKLHAKKPKSLLELGAGDGTLADHLNIPSLAFRITSDISIEMLLQSSPSHCGFRVVADAAQIPLKKSFDLILMTYDAINYLNKKQINALFSEIQRLLSDTGIFIFDVSTELNSLLYFENDTSVEDLEEVYIVRHSYYEQSERKQINRFDFFIREETGLYSRKTEVHEQTIYPHVFFLKIGKKHCLKAEGFYSDFTLNSDVSEATRIHYIFSKAV